MGVILHREDNLVNYYVLPLVGVNYHLFGRKFKKAFINKELTKVFVKVSDFPMGKGYSSNSTHLSDAVLEGRKYVIYNIPSKFRKDLTLFKNGKYSKMSRETKKIIYNGSGLPYNKKVSDFRITSPILQSLDKTKVLRKYLNTYFGMTIKSNAEYIDEPEPSWFIENELCN